MMMEEAKRDPLYSYLCSLKHDRKTNFRAGTINNPDAIVLLFSLLLFVECRHLEEFSRDWRKSSKLKVYFDPHSGYTGTDFLSGNVMSGPHGPCSGAPNKLPFWYRHREREGKTRYANALTIHGYVRLGELRQMMGCP